LGYCLKPETINIKPYKNDIREYTEIEVLEVIIPSTVKTKRMADKANELNELLSALQ